MDTFPQPDLPEQSSPDPNRESGRVRAGASMRLLSAPHAGRLRAMKTAGAICITGSIIR
jgi:hypothetical protein